MLGVLIMRRIGVLIVAIMIAGRSGSSLRRTRLHENARRASMPCKPWGSTRSMFSILAAHYRIGDRAADPVRFLGMMSALYGGGLGLLALRRN